MPDGTRLMFGGLERTGGIVVMDISTPCAPVFQDYLNVRNWMASEEDKAAYKAACDADDESAGCKDFMVAKALNDGPESLVFVPLADVPAGVTTPLLLAVTPLAGRLARRPQRRPQPPEPPDLMTFDDEELPPPPAEDFFASFGV